MAASNCGSMLKRCSFKIHCRFFTLSLMGANARASRLNLYGGPVGRGYEQRFESKNEYEQRSESKIAYGPRAKLRTVREQNCVRSESKIAYGPRAKLRIVREQKRAGAESKNAYELTAVCGWTFSLIIRALRYMV